MKKAIARLVSFSLLLCVCAAGAESTGKTRLGKLNVNGTFDLNCAIPEGYELNIIQSDTTQIKALIASQDETKPVMTLTVAYNELCSEIQRLNDVSSEDLAKIEETFKAEDAVEISYRETSYGTKLLMVRAADQYVDFYTIYLGYEIEFLLTPGTEGLSEAQIQMVVDFLSDLDFDAAA